MKAMKAGNEGNAYKEIIQAMKKTKGIQLISSKLEMKK